jgi:hypothetical protein
MEQPFAPSPLAEEGAEVRGHALCIYIEAAGVKAHPL